MVGFSGVACWMVDGRWASEGLGRFQTEVWRRPVVGGG